MLKIEDLELVEAKALVINDLVEQFSTSGESSDPT